MEWKIGNSIHKKIFFLYLTVLGRIKKRFHYRVKIPRAETLFLAMDIGQTEEASGWDCSKLFRNDFTLNIMNQYGEKTFTMIMKSRLAYMFTRLHVSSMRWLWGRPANLLFNKKRRTFHCIGHKGARSEFNWYSGTKLPSNGRVFHDL